MKEMNEKQQGAAKEDMAAANKSANEPQQAVVQEEAEVDMMKYLLMLWEQRRRVIKITAVFMLVGLVAALMETRIYTSKMTFAPESSNASRSGGLSSMAAMLGIGGLQLNNGPDAYNVLFYPDIVSSTPFLADLVDVPIVTKEGERMTYAEYLQNDKRWSLTSLPMKALSGIISLFTEKKEKPVITRDSIDLFHLTKPQFNMFKAMRLSLQMTVDKKTGESEITCTSSDPFVAAIVLDSARAHLQRYVTEYRTSKARANLVNYTKMADEAYKKYREASDALAYFQDHNKGLISNAVLTESNRLQNELNIASQVYTQMKQQEEVAKGKVYEDNPILAVIQPASVPMQPSNSRKKILLVYTFLGFMAASAWVLRKELLSLIPLSGRQ